MNLLLDTHLLLWAAGRPDRLSIRARRLITASDNQLLFSSASLWEIAVKNALKRPDFNVDTRRLWRLLLAHGYRELPVSSEHAIAVESLRDIHKDPFDRMLVAQARSDGLLLLTADKTVAAYGEGVRKV